jgi:2-oxo-4-hydroxy-4-carboxy-5-ureidoimidazoline decarboxylase
MTTISDLNTLSFDDATAWFMQTCSSVAWATLMAKTRPFATIHAIERQALRHWQKMQTTDFIEAFKGHPMIGDISSLRAKFIQTKALASSEQAGTASASEEVLKSLQQANYDYLDKHGFIFIICATGLSANEMLAQLRLRIDNTTEEEVTNASNEQMKITLLRIHKMLTIEEPTHD